jgi:2-polyprenyl-3-methyl-5-hydroxy-6-metoxy-1,4-benzoquinol methylase
MNQADVAALDLNFPASLQQDYPDEFPDAQQAVERIIETIEGADLDALARRSPALRGNDWAGYLRCSLVRMVHARRGLARRGATRGRLLDYGSYFGNFSLMCAAAGWDVDAVDAYTSYGAVFDGPRTLMRDAGITLLDFETVGPDLTGLEANRYDAILCMGVVEHIPHTPRLFLESLDRVLKPGGHLVVDTPNVGYLYNRQRFAAGESVWPPLTAQYYTEPPYEGHHREYTPSELLWMLRQLGHSELSLELFNYSIFGLSRLEGRDVDNYLIMEMEPDLREYMMLVSSKPHAVAEAPPSGPIDLLSWREALVESESRTAPTMPAEVMRGVTALKAVFDGGREIDRLRREHQRLHAEIDLRDGMLAKLQQEKVDDVQVRDEIIDTLRRERDYWASGK